MGAAYAQIISFIVMLMFRIYYTRKMARINQKLSYICSFVSLLLIVFFFNSGLTAKYPVIVLLILLILYFNRYAIQFLFHAVKIKIKTTQA